MQIYTCLAFHLIIDIYLNASAFKVREISEEELTVWMQKYKAASTAMKDRKELLEQVCM